MPRHAPFESGVPTPIAKMIPAGTSACVSVTFTVPVFVTVNRRISPIPPRTAPLKVSVVRVLALGDVPEPPHAAVREATTANSGVRRFNGSNVASLSSFASPDSSFPCTRISLALSRGKREIRCCPRYYLIHRSASDAAILHRHRSQANTSSLDGLDHINCGPQVLIAAISFQRDPCRSSSRRRRMPCLDVAETSS